MTSRLLLLVLLGLLALTGCSGDGDPPTTSAPSLAPSPPAPAPPPPRPDRAVCHRMSYEQAVAPTDDAELVSCATPHTAETFALGELRTIASGHLLAVDSAAVQQQVADSCPQRLRRFVGGTAEQLRLSMVRAVWFTPTVAESDAGANWFRCDVIVLDGEDRLAEVRGGLDGALATPDGRDRFGMCGTDEPGAADFQRVLCRSPHSWRAIGTVDLTEDRGQDATYPGVRTVRAAGQEVCDDQGRAVADDALEYDWGYEWPTADQWATGQTFGRCWAPDPS